MHASAARTGGIRHPVLLARLVNVPLLTTPANAYGWLSLLAARSDLVLAGLEGETVAPARYRRAAMPARQGTLGIEARPYRMAEGGIAVIEIAGTLANKWGAAFCGTTGYDWISETVAAASADPQVAGILLDVDSPGGEVAGCFDCADVIYRASQAKPVWASLSVNALSAGYALASQAERVIVPRTGLTGSIGVVCMHVDQSRMLDAGGLTVTLIHAGAHKIEGNPYQPLPEPVRTAFAASCERTRDLFAATVARARGLSVEAVLATEAACFEDADGVAAGLADEVLSPAEALAAFRDYLSGSAASGSGALAASAASLSSNRSNTMAIHGTARRGVRAGSDAPGGKPDPESTEEAPDGENPPDDGADPSHEDEDGNPAPNDEDGEKPEKDKPQSEREAKLYRAGRTAEARRWSAVLTAPAAKGRTDQAVALLGNAKLSVSDITGLLATLPRGGGLAEAMAGVGNVGGANAPVSGHVGPGAAVARIVGNYRRATGAAPRRTDRGEIHE